MVHKNSQPGTDRQRKEKDIKREPERIVAEINHIVRIKAKDFVAFKASFEEWAKQWE